jgi:hypothetical protein
MSVNIEFSNTELIALSKALQFVRFQSKDYEARHLAGSPHIAEVYKRISEATGEYYRSLNVPFPNEWPSIESINGYLDVIKIRIKDTDNWNDMQSDQRDSFLKTLVYPYKISDGTLIDLVRFGNEVHSKT